MSETKVGCINFGNSQTGFYPAQPPAQTFADIGKMAVRQFETGATRNAEEGKLDYEGFLSPAVLERYARYMHKNRKQADGSMRDSDNWQKGMPKSVYMKSAWRHFVEWWRIHRQTVNASSTLTPAGRVLLEEAICALIFNAMGYLHELLREE